MVTTVEHDIHRQRRNAVARFFSTASIRQLEPIIQATMSRLLERLEETAQASSPPVPIHHIFKACTSDVINKYAFGESFGFMERADFGKCYFDATYMFFGLNHIKIFFPCFATLMQKTPGWFIKAIIPNLAELVDKKSVCITLALRLLKAQSKLTLV
jgi:cytochrome P450